VNWALANSSVFNHLFERTTGAYGKTVAWTLRTSAIGWSFTSV